MIGTLILTHGGTARELLEAALKIAGPLSQIEALSLAWEDCFEPAKEKVRAAIERLDTGQGVLILTDMFGSTPSNVAIGFFQPGRVEILSGVNLPMVLRLACVPQRAESVSELARWLQAKAQKSVCLASEMPGIRSCEAPKCAAAPLALAEKGDG